MNAFELLGRKSTVLPDLAGVDNANRTNRVKHRKSIFATGKPKVSCSARAANSRLPNLPNGEYRK